MQVTRIRIGAVVLAALFCASESMALDRLLMLGAIPLKPKARPQSGGGSRPTNRPPRSKHSSSSEPSDEDTGPAPTTLATVSPQQAYQEAVKYLNAGDLEAGRKRLKQAADGGVADAEFAYATYSLMGTAGVPQSKPTANAFYERAAQHGNKLAMYNIGISYADGDGLPRDPAKAFKWFQAAANAGVPEGMLQTGKFMEKGLGTARNPAGAKSWLQRAADAGNAEANGLLAEMSGDEGGKGSGGDRIKYLQKAADGGDAQAMNDLGLAYLNGEGVPKDVNKAKTWIRKAVRLGNEAAIQNEATFFSGK